MATHRFAPHAYHTTLGPHPPVLRIASGDTVVTSTVDARGYDRTGEQVTERGNPMTGPFLVEGAQPGDLLAVRFDRLWPNRTRGWTRTAVAANALEPGFQHGVPAEPELAEWTLDLEAGTACLQSPGTRLGGHRWPLAPMLGCFGVAPSGGQCISTATSGPHGGNMDYRGFAPGVTVHLPVFVPGALFHLGDGHALQGDGEIVGTGVETSFDVTFTVTLRRPGEPARWPRAVSADYLMTVGNARPLDQCVQHATTEMLRWLTGELGLDVRSAHALLGQFVEYDLANVFDPAYTMVCKVPRCVLARLGVSAGVGEASPEPG
jgi:amidase